LTDGGGEEEGDGVKDDAFEGEEDRHDPYTRVGEGDFDLGKGDVFVFRDGFGETL